jgi:hypothetical protein
MNNFQPHGPPGMTNPGMGMQMGAPQMVGNAMSPAMGGPRAASMMGVSLKQYFPCAVLLRTVTCGNCSTIKVYMQSQRALQWLIYLEGAEEVLLLLVTLPSTLAKGNHLSPDHRIIAWVRTSPWG